MANNDKLIQELRKLKQLIKNDPRVRAKYDIDGDGNISGREWDLARESVVAYLESEAARQETDAPETAPAASDHVFSQVKDAAGRDVPSEETPAHTDASGYGPIRVESFWGAIAMICLCQIYYFILFEGFVFVLGFNHRMILIWFAILFLVSVSAQVEVMIKINRFLSERTIGWSLLSVNDAEDFFKCLLAIGLAVVFILFCTGSYPFPSTPHAWHHTLLFFIFIWILSYAGASNLKKGIESTQPLGIMNIIPVIMGLGFFTAGVFVREIFYMAGTFGMGFALIPIRPLLLCNQFKKTTGI